MTDLTVIEGKVHVDIATCRLHDDTDIAISCAWADLNEEERARAENFVFEYDRERFVRGRGFLRRQLGAFIGLPARDVPIATAVGGKPYVSGHKVSFNLSHSGDLAVVAITSGPSIGIDLELADRSGPLEVQLSGLSEMCLNRHERLSLANAPPVSRARRFLAYWTAKEARMKLTGEGLMLEPRAINLQLEDGRPVGYLRPRAPDVALRWLTLPGVDALCCLALALGLH
jgi:4'-phosphopantetheinyl transferase